MNQLEYLPGIAGQSVQLDGPSAFVGIAENLRSREWEYDLGYRDLVSATRPAREVDVTFNADYATADELRRVADADVTARTPGIFIAQKEWRQRGYILASQPNDIHYGRLSTELKIALLDGAWWRLVDKNFMPEDTTPTYRSATGKSVTTDGAANVPLHALTVDGEAVQNGTPTPSEPVDVQVVQGINIFNPAESAPASSPTTSRGLTVTYKGNGIFNVSGTSTASTNGVVTVMGDSTSIVIAGETLTLSVFGNFNSEVRFQGMDANGNTYAITSDGGYATLSVGIKRLVVYVHTSSNGKTYDFDFKIQVENGSVATPYVPYGSIGLKVGSNITPIDLQGNVLASLPDGTKDVLTVDSAGHCVLEKRVGVATFDGSNDESWGFNADAGFAFAGLPNAKNVTTTADARNLRCNRFHVSGGGGAGTAYQSGTNALMYTGSGFSPTSSAEARTWAASNNIMYCYKLATPQTIDLDYIDMPNVFDGAVVSITAEVTPTITAEWQTSPDLYLDYPHDYPYDYQKTSSTESITPSVLTPSDVYLVVYGPAVNPYVIVGGNRYQVNVTVPAGGYLTVDGRKKSIMLTLADGTVQNVFSSGVRGGGAGGGSYIFEKVPAGTSEVTYDGSFGFDFGWYEEEGEPPWNQS